MVRATLPVDALSGTVARIARSLLPPVAMAADTVPPPTRGNWTVPLPWTSPNPNPSSTTACPPISSGSIAPST